MPSIATQPSLLERVRDTADQAAWREFHERYGELFIRYCRRLGLTLADAEDVCQIALLNLSRTMPHFRYDPARGRFRDYLGRIVRHAAIRVRARHDSPSGRLFLSDGLDVASTDSPDQMWEREWTDAHARRALQNLRETFDARSVAVFNRLLEGRPPSAITEEFGITPESLRKIKQRVREALTKRIAAQIRDEEFHGEPDAP